MPRRRFPALLIAVGVALGPTAARAADAPPTPAPAPSPAPTPSPAPAADPEREAALRRAEELNARVVELWQAGQFREAEPLAREALEIRERVLGPDDPLVAASLMNLGAQFEGQGKYADARRLYERSLAIREAALGKDHAEVAASLNNLATVLRRQSDYAAAKPLYERALAIVEKTQGKDHPEVARILGNLAGVLRAEGSVAQARSHYERAISILEKAFGKDHARVAMTVHNLASLCSAEGQYAQAQALYERALAILERTWGADHPNVAATARNLAAVLSVRGAYAEAIPLAARALAIHERAFGKDHPEVAATLTVFAQVLRAEGAFARARALHERALSIRERTLGKDHVDVAESLRGLADLLHDQGAYAEARPLYERAVAITERVLGADSPGVAVALNNLATLLHDQGDSDGARPLAARALAIGERAFGRDQSSVSHYLNNLAAILEALGERAGARSLYERALAIREKALGPHDLLVATVLANLGNLRAKDGAFAEARLLLERALAIQESAHGKDHPAVGEALGNLAMALHALGDDELARGCFLRSLAIDEIVARRELSALSGSQRLARGRSTRLHRDRWVDFTRAAGVSGHAELLRLRGVVARAEAAERALARRATDKQRATLASLQAATRWAARLANEPPGPAADRAAWQERYAKAAGERERLTRELTQEMASARTALERLDLTEADVRRALPPDTALVDALRAGDKYAAWVLHAQRDVVRVELGAADAIDAACEAFVAAVTDDVGDDASREAVAKTGADLRALVWAPLAEKLGPGVARVVICPDAALASVPFAALPGASPGAFLGDEVVLSHVFHPFDVVPPRERPASGVGALVVGGVDYDHAEAGSKETTLPVPPPVLAALDRAPRGGAFLPIPATKAEAEALRARFGTDASTLVVGAAATEARVREGVKGRRFVHVATHGFARTDLLAGLYERKVKDAFLSADAERQLSVGHDPMLLSGLAMAGANPRDGGGGDDGVLTALEASYLDLEGVDLVTLSACETAKGTAESGEGVLGLVSAFQMAGARGVLASLWKVDDEATRLLMEGVYERILRGEDPLTPAAALRASARALRDTKDPATGKARFAAPRYWAAFVAYGG